MRRSTTPSRVSLSVAVGPAASGPSQNGGWPVGSVGPNRDDVGTVSRIAEAFASVAPAKIDAESTVSTVPITTPSMNRRRRIAAAPRRRRAMPRPLNRLVAARAISHG